MRLPSFCIDRPVFSTVLSLLIVTAGLLGFWHLNVRFQPHVFRPLLRVITQYPGADPETVEKNITTPLEKALAQTQDLERMVSFSSPEHSTLLLTFKPISEATFLNVKSQVLQEMSSTSLPQQARAPILLSTGANTVQLMLLAVEAPNMTYLQRVTFVNNNLLPRLQRIPGTSDTYVLGGSVALFVDLLPRKLSSAGLTVQDVREALQSNNTSLPSGALVSSEQRIELTTDTVLPDVPSFQKLVIAHRGGRAIHLRDVAQVHVAMANRERRRIYVNGQPGVALGIGLALNANPIAVGNRINALLKNIAHTLPLGMRIEKIQDLSLPLRNSVRDVGITILEAILFVSLITFVFLGRLRATVIPLIMIPISLIGTFALMSLFGFSLNVMTLFALVLAVGLVVDDAIIIMENTYRHRGRGLPTKEAARLGVNEVGFSILGVTLSLVAVYLPAVFLTKNTTGVYYYQFAYTLASAVALSGFVALTLSPVMCSRFLGTTSAPSPYETWIGGRFERLQGLYERGLSWLLGRPMYTVMVLVVSMGAGIFAFWSLPLVFLPKHPSDFGVVYLRALNTASAEGRAAHSRPLLNFVRALPDVGPNVTFTAGNAGRGVKSVVTFFRLVPPSQRTMNQHQLIATIQKKINEDPSFVGGAEITDINALHGSGAGKNVYLKGNTSYTTLQHAAIRAARFFRKEKAVSSANTPMRLLKPTYVLHVRKERAWQLGVSLDQVSQSLASLYGGYTPPNQYIYKGVSYPIHMGLSPQEKHDFKALDDIRVRAKTGDLVPLRWFLSEKLKPTFPDRLHINQLRAGEVRFSTKPGHTAQQAIDALLQKAHQVLPAGVSLELTGQALKLQKERRTMMMIMVLGVLFVYLILSALFESFREPLVVLLTVPLSVSAALIVLKLTGGTLNMYTIIALVTLIGLVAKHAILVTRFAEEKRKHTATLKEAVLEAAVLRFRPVLMTKITTILGATPLILSGVNGQVQLGTVIVFGLLLGTVFSLFIIPSVYLFLYARVERKNAAIA